MEYHKTREMLSHHLFSNANRLVDRLRINLTETYPNELSTILYQEDWKTVFDLLKQSQQLPAEFEDWSTSEQENWAFQNGFEPVLNEALEHWCVSPWLAHQLATHGEMVAEIAGLHLWGRTTSGQSVYLDSVMQEIAEKHLQPNSVHARIAANHSEASR